MKLERERQIPYVTTSMWNLNWGSNGLIYKTEIDFWTENRLVVAKEWGGKDDLGAAG